MNKLRVKIIELYIDLDRVPGNKFHLKGSNLEVIKVDYKLLIVKLFDKEVEIIILDVIDNYKSYYIGRVSLKSYTRLRRKPYELFEELLFMNKYIRIDLTEEGISDNLIRILNVVKDEIEESQKLSDTAKELVLDSLKKI